MKKIEMKPGKRYKGYAWINDFGQIRFDPAQIGSRPEQCKLIDSTDAIKLVETKNYVIGTIKIEKPFDKINVVKLFLQHSDNLLKMIMSYDF